jgi:Domain of unknown function (DUF4150)
MGKPITTTAGGICFAFPNVCKTPAVPSPVPIPYPSIGQLSDAQGTATSVNAGRKPVVTKASSIQATKGDSAGTGGGVTSLVTGGPVGFKTFSGTVFANGSQVVRLFDQTEQNKGPAGANAIGIVLGGFPTVLVGD